MGRYTHIQRCLDANKPETRSGLHERRSLLEAGVEVEVEEV